MFSEFRHTAFAKPARLRLRPSHAAVLSLVTSLVVGCGHKAPPVPPPLRNPATTRDLTVQQRGEEFVLSFAYPQTTVSGTPLEPLQRIEVWEVVRPVPEWTAPTQSADDEDDLPPANEATGEQTDDDSGSSIFGPTSGAGDDPSLPDPPADAEPEPESAASAEADQEDDEQDGATGSSDVMVSEPTKEELIRVEGAEFAATATLRVTYEEAAVEASSLGDRILLTLPIDAKAAENDSSEEAEPLEMGSIFAVKTGVSAKLMSGFSNTVAIAHRTPPGPPAGFEIEPEQTRVTVRWETAGDAVAEIVGYHVHRREAQNPRYGLPLAFVPIVEPTGIDGSGESDDTANPEALEPRTLEYVDRSATLGQRYIYALTTVSNQTPLVESAITVERELDYTDRFAPRAPSNVIALAETGRIRLLWDASPAPDLDGYFVEKREQRGEWARLNDEPVTTTEFSDRDIVSGRTYSYRVVATDRSNNESAPGEAVDVRAP